MSRTTATLCKFIGTISLGLLTGISYTTPLLSLPPLIALPTSQPASQTFPHLRALTTRHCLLLSSLSGTSLLLAYVLSPPRFRHPYLLWATLAVGAAYGGELYGGVMGGFSGKGKKGTTGENGNGNGSGGRRTTPDSSDEEWEVEAGSHGGAKGKIAAEGELNGEAVREGMEKWRGQMVGKGVVWGVGWLVTVVGLWGDGA